MKPNLKLKSVDLVMLMQAARRTELFRQATQVKQSEEWREAVRWISVSLAAFCALVAWWVLENW